MLIYLCLVRWLLFPIALGADFFVCSTGSSQIHAGVEEQIEMWISFAHIVLASTDNIGRILEVNSL